MQPPQEKLVRERAIEIRVPAEDLDAVAERALNQLVNLNIGSAGRYRIRPSEFDAWSRQFRTKTTETSS
jgi:hypothetical protein